MKTERRTAGMRLHEILRQGDPAADGDVPAPAESARWRQRMLLEAGSTRPESRLARWLPGLAAALALAALVVVTLLVPPPIRQSPSVNRPVAGAPEAVPQPVAETAGGTGGNVVSPTSRPLPSRVSRPLVARQSRPPDRGLRRPQSVQFTAPNGTRIIWTLDPDFRL